MAPKSPGIAMPVNEDLPDSVEAVEKAAAEVAAVVVEGVAMAVNVITISITTTPSKEPREPEGISEGDDEAINRLDEVDVEVGAVAEPAVDPVGVVISPMVRPRVRCLSMRVGVV